MKLIAEYTNTSLDYVAEETASGRKDYYIEGVFMAMNQQNRNGRIYEDKVLRPAVEKYISEQVHTGRAVGELNHPEGPTVNLDKVSHRIVDLHFEGNNVIGKALILNTPMGQIAKGLLDGGVKLGVSSRGMGSVTRREGVDYVDTDFILNTVDIVQDPSAPNAFVNGIMEGKEWTVQNGVYLESKVNKKKETEINKKDIQEQLKVFKNFLSKL